MRARHLPRIFPLLGRAFAALLAACLTAAGQTTERVEMTPGSSVKIEITNPWGFVPRRGFVPLRVAITNGRDSEGQWSFSTTNASSYHGYGGNEAYITTVAFRVPAHATREFELLAPLADHDDYNYVNLSVVVGGPDVQRPFVNFSGGFIQPPSIAPTPMRPGGPLPPPPPGVYPDGPLNTIPVAAAVSASLFREHGDDIRNYLTRVCRRPTGLAAADPEILSADWRAYTGLTTMAFTAGDWTATPAAARAAILQWVATGGELRLIADQEGGLALPAHTGERYGAGFLLVFPQAGLDAYDYATARYTPGQRQLFNVEYTKTATPLTAGSHGDPFSAHIPFLENQFVFVAPLILVFAILVGPVNLFWFCRGSKRARLLWVTPLLSLGAALIMVVYILLAEGLGGVGVYYRVTLLEPEGKFAYVREVQASKTGVLLGRGFSLPDPAWAVNIGAGSDNTSRSYAQAGVEYWGDWIRTRHQQSMTVDTIQHSRAAVRLAPGGAGGPPSLVSEYNGVLEEVYYIDAAGGHWKAARLANGQTARLEPSTEAEVLDAWRENIARAPGELNDVLLRLGPRPGSFIALGADDQAAFEPQLFGLSWTCYRHVVAGRVAE